MTAPLDEIDDDPATRRIGALWMRRRGEDIDAIADILAVPVAVVRQDIITAGLAHGVCPRDVADLAGVSRAYVSRIARQEGLTAAHRRQERRRRVVELTEQGWPVACIGARLGIAVRTVHADRAAVRRAR